MKKRVNLQRSVLVLAVSQALVSYSLAASIPKLAPALVLMPRSAAKVENPSIKTDNNSKRTDNKVKHSSKTTTEKHQIEDVTVGATVPQGKKPETNYTVRSSKSATKLDLAPKDTPQSITNFTQQILKDQNMETIGDVLNATPGVSVSTYGVPGAAANAIMARGFPVNNYQLDGMMTNAWALGGPMAVGNQDSFLYEGIDLVRGSVGLLTGAGNPSASINFTRKKPYSQNQGQFNLKYGSWNTFRQELDYSTALNKSRSWRARVALTHEKGDYHIERANHKGYSAYGVTELDVGNSSKFTLGASYQQRRYNEVPPHGVALGFMRGDNADEGGLYRNRWVNNRWVTRQSIPRSFNNATRWTTTENSNSQVFAGFQHYFANDWQLDVNYNYARSENDNLMGIIGRNYFSPEVGLASYDQAHTTHKANSHSMDIALKGQFHMLGQQQDFVVGINGDRLRDKYYELLKFSNNYHADAGRRRYNPKFIDAIVLADWFSGGSFFNRWPVSVGVDVSEHFQNRPRVITGKYDFEIAKNKQYGLYLATHLRPMANLSVIAGARYNRNKNTYTKYWEHPLRKFSDWDKAYWEVGKPNKATFSPYLGLIYRFTPSINAYASYIHMVTLDTYGGHIVSADGGYVPPVINNTFETGLKAGFYDNRLNLAIAYFNMQQDNYPIVDASNFYAKTPWMSNNLGEPAAYFDKGYTINGGELTIAGELTPRWKIMAGYVYQSHKKPPKLPEANFNGGGWDNRYYQNLNASFLMPTQSFKLFTSYLATPQLTIGGGIDWQSATHGYRLEEVDREFRRQQREAGIKMSYSWDFTNKVLFTQKAYARYNLMASYRFNKQLAASLNISNLTNKAYYTNDKGSYQGEPRKITLQLGAKF